MKRFAIPSLIALAAWIAGTQLGLPSPPTMHFSATPKAVLTGPHTAPAGERIVLDGRGSTGALSWKVVLNGQPAKPNGVDYELTDAGRQCWMASRPGSAYTATAIAFNSRGVDVVEWTVTVPPAGPTPPAPIPPAPGPAPGPTPPGPAPVPPNPEPEDGRFGLAKAVFRAAKVVDSPSRAAECQALAAVFSATAAKVAAGGLNGSLLDPQWKKISRELAAGNKSAIQHAEAWKPASDQLGERISQLYSEGKLDSNADWHDLLTEIARGLTAAAG